jgi:hypothetical protein
MQERDWLAHRTGPTVMLHWLQAGRRASDRQLHLFACACCRRVWPLLADARSRRAVEVSERYADGRVGAEELEAARRDAEAACAEAEVRRVEVGHADEAAEVPVRAARAAAGAATWGENGPPPRTWGGADFVTWATRKAAWLATLADAKRRAEVLAASDERQATLRQAARVVESVRNGEWQAQCNLLRDVVGNPFRPRPAINPHWLAWGWGTVGKIARAIYEEVTFDRLPVLADALEEAGCADTTILSHCRSTAPHAPGCWVVDLLLGKG